MLEGIDAARTAGLAPIKVNVVVQRGLNDHTVPELLQRFRHTGVIVRFIEFMPFDGNNWQLDKVFSFSEILSDISKHTEFEKLKDKPNSTAKSFRVLGGEGTFAVISTVTENFCSSCNRIRLTADGKLVYIDKEIVSQATEGSRASNKEILEWMKNPSKKEE